MQAVQFDTQLKDGSGYAYLTIPRDLLDAGDSVRVKLTINGYPYVARTIRRLNGDHEVQFNRESMYNLELKSRQKLAVTLERLETPPQLNDLPADFLGALAATAMQENYKRLPPETQRKYLEKVEKSPAPNQRADTIRQIVSEIESQAGDLPRGESL